MTAELIKIHPDNLQISKIRKIVEILEKGGLIIYPTDTIYGLGCNIYDQKAIEKIQIIKNIKEKDLSLSFICYDLKHVSQFVKLENSMFKLMKQILPGPYTFIFKANNQIPKLMQAKKKTIGIRIPDNPIPREVVNQLGNPIITTSLKLEDDVLEYPTDPEIIYDEYKKLVDLVIDGGPGGNIPSTVLDFSKEQIEVIRQGKGNIDFLK